MATKIDGTGLITVDGTSTTQGRVRLAEDTDNGTNYVELTAPASLTSNQTITFPDGTGTVAVNGVNGVLVSDTAKTATSTSVDFTGIPSWVKRITVMFSGVSTNGTSNYLLQLGAGSVTASGYFSTILYISSTSASASGSTAGFLIGSPSAASTASGSIQLTLIGSNAWAAQGALSMTSTAATAISGAVTLSGTLDRVRITTVNGTDTFDAGTINILYE